MYKSFTAIGTCEAPPLAQTHSEEPGPACAFYGMATFPGL